MPYFDSSALVKRYVDEIGSGVVRRRAAWDRVFTSRLTEVEVVSAVHRRVRQGSISASDRDEALSRFESDWRLIRSVEVTTDILDAAKTLLARHPLSAADALQLASALFLRQELQVPVEIVVFDGRLTDAAREEGLTTWP